MDPHEISNELDDTVRVSLVVSASDEAAVDMPLVHIDAVLGKECSERIVPALGLWRCAACVVAVVTHLAHAEVDTEHRSVRLANRFHAKLVALGVDACGDP